MPNIWLEVANPARRFWLSTDGAMAQRGVLLGTTHPGSALSPHSQTPLAVGRERCGLYSVFFSIFPEPLHGVSEAQFMNLMFIAFAATAAAIRGWECRIPMRRLLR